jgi:hypothetical protein
MKVKTKWRNRRTALLLFLTAACSAVLIGTGSTSNAQTARESFLRVAHGSPDGAAVDVFLNGVKQFETVKFQAVTDYLPVKPGTARIEVVASGTTPKDGPVLISTTTKLNASQDYTLVVFGRAKKLDVMLLSDDNTIDKDGQAKVRLVQLAPDAPAVDFVVPAQNNLKLFTNVTYKTFTAYLRVPPGAYSFYVRPTGTDANKLDVKGLPLDPGSVTTIYAVGLWSGNPKFALAVSQDWRPEIVLPVTGGALE